MNYSKQLRNFKKQGLFILLICFILITSFSYGFFKTNLQKKFLLSIERCGQVEDKLRFSCYRFVIEDHFGKNTVGFGKWLHQNHSVNFETGLKGQNISYAIFGTNCHTFYHAAGDYVATHSKSTDIKYLRNLGTRKCTDGYTMGLYKRLALKNQFDTSLLLKLYEACPENTLYWCSHEIGHLLYDKYTYSILKILDELTTKHFKLSYNQSYQYTTFADEKADQAFEQCSQLFSDDKRTSQCWSGIGHDLFLFTEFSSDGNISAKEECLATTYKSECMASFTYRVGLNKGAPNFLSHQFEEGNKRCSEVSDGNNSLLSSCYRGIGRGIGLYFNSEYANKIISKKTSDLNKEILEDQQLCKQSNNYFVVDCENEFLETKIIRQLKNPKINNAEDINRVL